MIDWLKLANSLGWIPCWITQVDLSKYVFALVDGIAIKHQADSASDVNLWPNNYFRDFCDKLCYVPNLLQSSKPVRATNKTRIGVKGYFESTITSEHASKESKIFVMKADQEEYVT